jgi:hypothetical protein
MGFNFNFRQIDSETDIRRLVEFMAKYPLDYPGYDAWLQRAESELDAGYKQAILAFSEGTLVGNIVYQRHKQLPGTLEIKNLRVAAGKQRRDFGHFMLRQVQVEANRGDYGLILCDARESQTDVLALLGFSGFIEIARAALYDSNERDVIMGKPIKREGLIQTVSWFN